MEELLQFRLSMALELPQTARVTAQPLPRHDDLETTVKRRGLTQGWVLLGLFDRK